MSDPTPPIPPTLSYQTPERRGLPIGVQAFLGCIFTLTVLSGLCFGAGFLAITTNNRATCLTILALSAALVFSVSFYYARRLRRDEHRRGWSIGVYIGMGLAGLFWGFCGFFLNALAGPH